MSRGPSGRWRAGFPGQVPPLVVLGILALGCGDEAREDAPAWTEPRAGEAPAEEAVEARVFLREPGEGVGPGRATLHFLVAADAGGEQVRQALLRVMGEAAAEDTSLVALRAVAYRVAPPQGGEAEVAPVGWGEWLPPGGWAAPDAARAQRHRFHTYVGLAPEW